MGFIDGAGSDHQIAIAILRALLQDPRLMPTDDLRPNSVGNFAIYREGRYIGYVDMGFDEIEFWIEV
jgi:hypothetical protein